MDRNEEKKLTENVERAVYESMSDPRYWARKRAKWDEWGSPVGLSLGWAIFVVSCAGALYLLRLAGLI